MYAQGNERHVTHLIHLSGCWRCRVGVHSHVHAHSFCWPWTFLEHGYSSAWLNKPHYNKSLEQGICQLRILQQHLPSLIWIVMDTHFHLLHKLKHLLWGKRGNSFRNNIRCKSWIYGVPIRTFSRLFLNIKNDM